MRFFKPNIPRMLQEKNINGLIKALNDEDWNLCAAAREALQQIGAPAVGALITSLSQSEIKRRDVWMGDHYASGYVDEKERPRNHAATTLGEIAAHSSDAALCERMLEPLLTVSREVLPRSEFALGMLKMIPPLASASSACALENFDSNGHKVISLQTLSLEIVPPFIPSMWMIPETKGCDQLLASLDDTSGTTVREAAITALGKVFPHLVDPALRERVLDALVAALGAETADVRNKAVAALGAIATYIGDVTLLARVVEGLIAALKDGAWLIQKGSEVARENPGDLIVVGAVVDFSAVQAALITIGRPMTERLLPLLQDEDERLRQVAEVVLGR
jgi:HEAT repeat protein